MLATTAFATMAGAQELGRVHFDTSCTPAAQEKFDRGLAMVHSFVYPDSVQAFTESAAADPQCAIAYWGIAISHRPNPLILPLPATVLKNGLEAVERVRRSVARRSASATGSRRSRLTTRITKRLTRRPEGSLTKKRWNSLCNNTGTTRSRLFSTHWR